jgi:hypothetical protein
MKRVALLLALLAGCATARTAPAPAPNPDADAVIAVTNLLFDAMRTRDTAMVRSLFTPQARLVSLGRQNGVPAMRERAVAEFVVSVATAPEPMVERMWNVDVRVEGDLATLWAPYDFYRGERFSHCGMETLQFVRVRGAWLIASFSYTVQPQGCPPAPPR